MALIGVAHEDISKSWPYVADWIRPAIVMAKGRISETNVLEDLKSKKKQLWVYCIDNNPVGACVTEILIYPEIKVLAIPLIGAMSGYRWDWLQYSELLEDYARFHDCVEMEGYARRGWVGMSRRKDGGVLGNDWSIGYVKVFKKVKPHK